MTSKSSGVLVGVAALEILSIRVLLRQHEAGLAKMAQTMLRFAERLDEISNRPAPPDRWQEIEALQEVTGAMRQRYDGHYTENGRQHDRINARLTGVNDRLEEINDSLRAHASNHTALVEATGSTVEVLSELLETMTVLFPTENFTEADFIELRFVLRKATETFLQKTAGA